MCLTTKYLNPLRIKEDMYVYKRFWVKINKNRRSITIKTPYQLMQIARNKVQKFNCIDCEYSILEQFGQFNTIQYGYHAYETEERALFHLCPGEIIVKCKIPAGSYVWFGLFDEVCSNNITIDLTHNTKDITSFRCKTENYEILKKCFKYMP